MSKFRDFLPEGENSDKEWFHQLRRLANHRYKIPRAEKRSFTPQKDEECTTTCEVSDGSRRWPRFPLPHDADVPHADVKKGQFLTNVSDEIPHDMSLKLPKDIYYWNSSTIVQDEPSQDALLLPPPISTAEALAAMRRKTRALQESDIKMKFSAASQRFDSSHDEDSYSMATGADDDSMDSELLSFSDSSSDDIEHSGLDDKAYSEIVALVRELVTGHTTTAAGGRPPNESRSSEGQPAHPPAIHLPKKRRHTEKKSENSDDEEPPIPPSKGEEQNKGKGRDMYLACPFAKNDPLKHQACFSKRLSRIRDVKQHLARKHTPEFYCSRCSAIFLDHDKLQAHIGNAAGLFCTPSPLLEGISQHKRSQLSRKSNPRLTAEEQWFSMWDIIFPDHPRPDSAYIDFGFSRDFCSYREYSHRRAVVAVVEGLRTSSLAGKTVVTQNTWEEVRRIVADRLDSVFEEWQSNQFVDVVSRPKNPSLNSQRSSIKSTRINTPDSFEDNGIDVGSQQGPYDGGQQPELKIVQSSSAHP
ncbi:uncharacterized protein F4807DRAFT_464063 [Annulohypoxylon truncatum]|uniref:uncharacterized protein n=1 Tax=Annulohypoxylon truncatum TaxID=327061 RepID=UPI002007AD6B|nr:uncharacterized protein F4807DRAFT_464063 [Annulohypoxylon truncatum]KAI1206053.1 hypothetical protein F4807DRAFT_464063 [Annulohypoxylon truncatum]